MDSKTLARSIKLAESVRYLLVATVNAQGTPHLATAERITLEDRDRVAVTAWFCPQTAENVQANPAISVAVWDSDRDLGFQLVGEVEKVVDLAMLDGFIPEETAVSPQIERKLVIRVRHILDFSHAPHSDTEAL
jgi:hypothetical protein